MGSEYLGAAAPTQREVELRIFSDMVPLSSDYLDIAFDATGFHGW